MNLSFAIIILLCIFIFLAVAALSLNDRLIMVITRISGLYALIMGIFLFTASVLLTLNSVLSLLARFTRPVTAEQAR